MLLVGLVAGVLVAHIDNDGARNHSPKSALQPVPIPEANPTVDQFVATLAGEVCSQLEACVAMDRKAVAICFMVAGDLRTTDAAARIASGECRYDGSAARRCLEGVAAIDCAGAQDDADLALNLLGTMLTCVQAYRCE